MKCAADSEYAKMKQEEQAFTDRFKCNKEELTVLVTQLEAIKCVTEDVSVNEVTRELLEKCRDTINTILSGRPV